MKHLIILLLVALSFASCSKDADAECMDGTIHYTGDPAADGLGWVLVTTGTESPRYLILNILPAVYQQEQLSVKACLVNTGQKATCFCAAPPDTYRVVSIERR
jgi:hypothetical protein